MNVLISSAGRRGALVQIFQTTLKSRFGGGTVVAADRSSLSAAGALADHFEIVPAFDTTEFVPHMLKLCVSHDINLVIPTHDAELAIYARHKEAFAAAGTMVMVSGPETIGIGADKLRTYRWLRENEFPTVRTAPLQEALTERTGWRPPFFVKPVDGYGSAGVARVETWAALEALKDQKDLIVQHVAPGQEYTVDVWVDGTGRCRCAVPRARLEVRGGEVQKSVTVRHPGLEALASRVAETLPGAFGALNVQVFTGGDELAVIEINTRFGGGFPLSWQAGADFPHWALEEVTGHRPGPDEQAQWTAGLVMLRYDSAVFVQSSELGL